NIKGATEVALKNGKKAIKLIEEILELSKLEMIQVRLEERPVYFYSFVYGLYTMLKPRAELKNIHFQMELKIEKGTRILLDLTKFEKIFNNLVGNAIKFTPEGGKVTVILENLNGSQAIRLRVTDSGPGIDKEHLDAIFDRYYQCKNGTLQSGPGIGIGLALVKSYADLFEGQLKVESEKGSGATFEFQFAKKSVAAKQSASEMMDEGQRMDHPLSKEIPRPPLEEVPTLPSVAKRSKILIVEDNHDMAQFIKELLIANYQVIRAEDGIQALALLSQNEGDIDCVVSDIKMPNMDGLELLQHIRANDEWRSLPFLMLTAEVRVSQRFDAFTFGVDDYLIKPFSSDELLKRVKSLLHNSKQRSAWQTKENEQVPPGASKNSPQMTESDLEWLRDLEDIAAKEVSNRRFNLLELSSKMAVSERQLFRRIKRLTGMTPNKYLREMKLYKAKDLLENLTYGTISEVSYAVGFEDPYYFSKIYTMRFGKRPSEYLSKDNSLLKNG
ncbi:MAG: ATP-binding protein, partial [Bacteroidota bacterium]